jgi:hypothetical protein
VTDFLAEYEALAAEIAAELRMAATPFGDKIDGFKALTPFYLQKTKGKKAAELDDGPNFDSFINNIKGSEDGESESGLDRRRNGN